jgi:hypothetical protein
MANAPRQGPYDTEAEALSVAKGMAPGKAMGAVKLTEAGIESATEYMIAKAVDRHGVEVLTPKLIRTIAWQTANKVSNSNRFRRWVSIRD